MNNDEMRSAHRSTRPSAPRRLRYALFRAAYTARRTLSDYAVAGHIAVGCAIALLISVLIVLLVHSPRLPWKISLLPLAGAAIYAAAITAKRFMSAWTRFPIYREEMKLRRRLDLRSGGVRRAEFEAMTFWRVTVPYWATLIGGSLIVAFVTAGHRTRVPRWAAYALLFAVGIATMKLQTILAARNERYCPTELERFCPRCGYDVSQNPERCPECGLRKMDRQWDQENGGDLCG